MFFAIINIGFEFLEGWSFWKRDVILERMITLDWN